MSDDGRVFDRLFGSSEPPSGARSASETHPIAELPHTFWFEGLDAQGRVVITPQTVDVDALLRAIDKLEASVARLKRFLGVL